MNIIHEISIINAQFAERGCKLKIEKRGAKLNIRGALPSKENENILKVQRISLGIAADLLGLKEAKKKLQLINLQLELNQFDWNKWIIDSKKKTLEAKTNLLFKINEFEKFFFSRT